MCDTCSRDKITLEVIDSRDMPPGTMQPVIDAAFAADKAATCCLQRKNAVSRAVFETARELGYEVAWGDLLNPEAPDFYAWPNDTWRLTFIREYLDDHRAIRIYPKDFS